MNLAQILKMDLKAQNAIIVGTPIKTNFLDSDNKPYYKCQLKDEITVTCSTDPGLDSFPTKEVYVRENDLNSDGWKMVTENKPEDGYYRENWVVDFSSGQALPLYQAETIKQWAKGQRTDRRTVRRTELNAKIKAGILGNS